MPPKLSSAARKEEKEMRQMARQHREAKKEIKAKAAKQKRRLVIGKTTVQDAAATTATAGDTSKPKKHKRLSVMILPEEVQELKSRLKVDEDDVAPSPSKGAKKKGTKETAPTDVMKATPNRSDCHVPHHSINIHFKKTQFQLYVQLPKIPPQKINFDYDPKTKVITVDTTAHTRKFFLQVPIPQGLVIVPYVSRDAANAGSAVSTPPTSNKNKKGNSSNNDVIVLTDDAAATAKAPYHLEYNPRNEELIALFTYDEVNSILPEEEKERMERMMQNIKEAKTLRFRVTNDGNLTVRQRSGLLPSSGSANESKKAAEALEKGTKLDAAAAAATGATASKSDRKRQRDTDDHEGGEAGQEAKSAKTTIPATTKKQKREAPAAAPSKTTVKDDKKNTKKTVPTKNDPLSAEQEAQRRAAAAAGERARLSLRQKLKELEVAAARRRETASVTAARSERKAVRESQAFEKVLEAQKEQLRLRAVQEAAAQAELEERRERTAGSSKTVKFAE